jgi:hypothetical protein
MFKKLVGIILVTTLCAFSVSAASPNVGNVMPTSGVPSTDPYHGEGLNNTDNNTEVQPFASGLISMVSLDEYYDPSDRTLQVVGQTVGTEELNKIGLENIILQRWDSGTESWTNIKEWSYYEYNSVSCVYSYSLQVTRGYDYRFLCTHYAEKDILFIPMIQTMDNETSYLYAS